MVDPERWLRPGLLYPVKAGMVRARSLAWWARASRRPRPPGVRILFYHRISDDRDELAVAPRAFAEQMAALERAGLRGVRVSEAAEFAARGAVTEPVVGLSFDDAYADVATQALPVLERHGFTATVFVVTGAANGHVRFGWYDEQPALLGWEQISALDGGTLEFEPHTVTHPNLLSLDDDEARHEIEESKVELERRLGRPARVFCYPAGLFGERERAYAAATGFPVAVTCEPGPNTAVTDPLALRRIQVDARDAVLDVRAKAAGGHDRPLPLRGVWRRARYGAEPVESRSRP